jgi:hypothetical protein
MLHVQHGVQIEVVPVARGHAEPLQPFGDQRRAAGGGLLDDAQRADRVVGVTPVRGEAGHGVAQRQRLPHRGLKARPQLEALGQHLQHRAMHALRVAAAHLVPVVARDFQLRPLRQLHLGQRGQVLEARFAGDLLGQEPAHLVHARLLGEPREQRVVLPGAVLLQRLEPRDEAVRVGRRFRGAARDGGAEALQELALFAQEAGHLFDVALPVRRGQGRGEALLVRAGQAEVELLVRSVGCGQGTAGEAAFGHAVVILCV